MTKWLLETLNAFTNICEILRLPTDPRRASSTHTIFDDVLGFDICCISWDEGSFLPRDPRRHWAWNTRNNDVVWWGERHVLRWSGIRRSDTRRRGDFQPRSGGPWNSVSMAYLKEPAARCESLHLLADLMQWYVHVPMSWDVDPLPLVRVNVGHALGSAVGRLQSLGWWLQFGDPF